MENEKEFLSKNHISIDEYKLADIDWNILSEIADHHESRRQQLNESAAYFAKLMQTFDKVHTVRWRVKDTGHLIKKIIRKRSENQPKYQDISPCNYHAKITDLIGLRALHLYKDDCFAIDRSIRDCWEFHEPEAVAYIRKGDDHEWLKDAGFEVKLHKDGYRSIHYTVQSQPTRDVMIAEIQVRTIFEEGWSEIDHDIRYPDFTDNLLVLQFLQIFNRLAGSADEMGSFVKSMSVSISSFEVERQLAEKERDSFMQQLELSEKKVASLLGKLREADQLKSTVAELERELAKYKPSGLFGEHHAADILSESRGIVARVLEEEKAKRMGALEQLVLGASVDERMRAKAIAAAAMLYPSKTDK